MSEDVVEPTFLANRIMQNIFIGSGMAAEDEDFVFSNQISSILNCAGSEVARPFVGSGIKYLTLNWRDDPNAPIFDKNGEVAKKIISFISNAVEHDWNILIASRDGISRSVIALAIYLIAKYRWHPRRALQFIATKRIGCNPQAYLVRNLIFWSKEYEKKQREAGDTSEPFYKDIFGTMPEEQILQLSQEELLHRCTYQNAIQSQDEPPALVKYPSIPDFIKQAISDGMFKPGRVVSNTLRHFNKRQVHWIDKRSTIVAGDNSLFRLASPDYSSRTVKENSPCGVSYTLMPRVCEGFEIADLNAASCKRYFEMVGVDLENIDEAQPKTKNPVPPPFSILCSIPKSGVLSKQKQHPRGVYLNTAVVIRHAEFSNAIKKSQRNDPSMAFSARVTEPMRTSMRPSTVSHMSNSAAASYNPSTPTITSSSSVHSSTVTPLYSPGTGAHATGTHSVRTASTATQRTATKYRPPTPPRKNEVQDPRLAGSKVGTPTKTMKPSGTPTKLAHLSTSPSLGSNAYKSMTTKLRPSTFTMYDQSGRRIPMRPQSASIKPQQASSSRQPPQRFGSSNTRPLSASSRRE